MWLGGIWALAPVWQMTLIFLKSDHVFDPVNARTSWPTHESYLSDPYQWGWLLIAAALVLTVRLAPWGPGKDGLSR